MLYVYEYEFSFNLSHLHQTDYYKQFMWQAIILVQPAQTYYTAGKQVHKKEQKGGAGG